MPTIEASGLHMLRTVAAFSEAYEAHMFSSRLGAEGIPSFVEHSMHVGNAWHYSLALQGAKVQVFADDWLEARAIENLCCLGEFRSLLETEFGPLEEICCPNCGAMEKRKRRAFLRTVAAILASILSGVPVPPLGWLYFCKQCETKYCAPLYVRPTRERIVFPLIALLLTMLISALFIGLRICIVLNYWIVPVVLVAIPVILRLNRWIAQMNEGGE